MVNYETLCAKVVEITRVTGQFILNEAQRFDSSSIEYKGLNDLVSYVDKQAEQQLVEKLSQLLPNSGFITEEDTVDTFGEVFTWIIDPLDGTTNFIHGIPTFSVSIALFEYNKPVIGVVYEINRDEMFYTFKGGSAFLNGKQIQVSKNSNLSQCLLATGFPYYQFDKQQQYIQLFTDMMKQCHGLRRLGSAAVDLAYVACGRFDGYFEYNLNAYDVAAGAFLVQQAGGEIFNFSGGEEFIERREVVATNGMNSKEILTTINKYF
jgi:myo-inositol-1(or 4)-monophosphatase